MNNIRLSFDPNNVDNKYNNSLIKFASYNTISRFSRYIINNEIYTNNKYYLNLDSLFKTKFNDMILHIKEICTFFYNFSYKCQTSNNGIIIYKIIRCMMVNSNKNMHDPELYLNALWIHIYNLPIFVKFNDHNSVPIIDLILTILCYRLSQILELCQKNNIDIEILSETLNFFKILLTELNEHHKKNNNDVLQYVDKQFLLIEVITYDEQLFCKKNFVTPIMYQQIVSNANEVTIYDISSDNIKRMKLFVSKNDILENNGLLNVPYITEDSLIFQLGCFKLSSFNELKKKSDELFNIPNYKEQIQNYKYVVLSIVELVDDKITLFDAVVTSKFLSDVIQCVYNTINLNFVLTIEDNKVGKKISLIDNFNYDKLVSLNMISGINPIMIDKILLDYDTLKKLK